MAFLFKMFFSVITLKGVLVKQKNQRLEVVMKKMKMLLVDKGADALIISNMSEVNQVLENSNIKKAKTYFILELISKMLKIKSKSTILRNLGRKNLFFNDWKNKVTYEKRGLLISIKSLQDANCERVELISSYEEDIVALENKMKLCTLNAEKCEICSKLLNDHDSAYGSIREEEFHKEIPSFRTKSILHNHHEPDVSNAKISSHKVNNTSFHSFFENPNEQLALDENTGFEYLSYLEKTVFIY